MRVILVTRPLAAAEEVVRRLERGGFDALAAPLTEYEPRAFDVPELNDYQALVFTSAQGVREFSKAVSSRRLPVFCVGEATEGAALAAGFDRVFCARGDVAALGEMIVAKRMELGLARLLHVSGEDVAGDPGAALKPHGVVLDRLAVYGARLLDRLPPEAERVLKAGREAAVLFFSARAAAQFGVLAEKEGWNLARAEAVCISGRAAAALKPGWKAVRVAQRPALDAVLDVLRPEGAEQGPPPLKAGPVLEAFGGLRPLAQALGITASTVQGWKQRGVIPGARAGAILEAARARGIETQGFMMTDEERGAAGAAGITTERRTGADRRVKRTPPDDRGHIRAEGYEGPDRRMTPDRRAYHERQRQRVWHEKMKFVNRATVSVALFVAAVIYAVYFLLAPEIGEITRNAARVKEMEARMAALDQQVAALEEEKKSRPLGGVISRRIEEAESAAGVVREAAQAAAGRALSQVAGGGNVDGLLYLLSQMQAMSRSAEGRAALAGAAEKLSRAAALAGESPEDLGAAVAVARKGDPVLSNLLARVEERHLGAAGMLLALNTLREALAGQGPFAVPLALALKFTGHEPLARAALEKLLPYAEAGLGSRAALSRDFAALPAALAAARAEEERGGAEPEDASLEEKARKGLSSLVRVRRAGEDAASAAVLARARAALDAGDIAGAAEQLKALEGAEAKAAAPWIARAEGHVLAADSSAVLSHAIMQILSSAAEGGSLSVEGFADVLKEALPAPAVAVPAAQVPYMSPSMLERGNTGSAVPGGLPPFRQGE